MFELLRNRIAPYEHRMAYERSPGVADLTSGDLPCPWCRAETDEGDVRCGACGRRFG